MAHFSGNSFPRIRRQTRKLPRTAFRSEMRAVLSSYYNNRSPMSKTFPVLRAFLFDLDGTLIDSKLDLVTSVNAMLRQMGRAQLSTELVASYIGHGAPQLIAS